MGSVASLVASLQLAAGDHSSFQWMGEKTVPAGVFGSIPAGETWSGYPARPHKEALRAQAAMFKLPSLIRALERLVTERDDKR